MSRSQVEIVFGFRHRADCCRRHPSNMASKTAGAGSKWVLGQHKTRAPGA